MSALFLFIAVMSNSFMDAIDHGKGERTLKELWHSVKYFLFYPSVFLSGYFFKGALHGKTIFEAITLVTIMTLVFCSFEIWYPIFLKAEVWRLDDKFKCEFLRKLFRLNYKRELLMEVKKYEGS